MARESCEVAIVGAGPYGLAVASHLKAAGVEAHVFGDVMAFWRRNMPSGMKLRSPWRASTIGDPDRMHTLDAFAQANGIARTENLPLSDFVRYGEWFQRRAVPNVDRRMVKSIAAAAKGFELGLDDGERVHANRVVVAMGLTNQESRPPQFETMPAELVSHSSAVVDPKAYAGRRIAVIGRGQSACESAVLLSEAGAEVDLICRGPIRWIGHESGGKPEQDKLKWLIHALISAPSGIGPFPYNWLVDMPSMLYRLPADWRSELSVRSLRAAAGAWLRVRSGGVQVKAGRTIGGVQAKGDRVRLQLDNGASDYDHVVLATGYRTDLSKLAVLSADLLQAIALESNFPVLSPHFESSVKGLHFVGSPAVGSFGPLPRFVAGSGYAARSVARGIAAQRVPAASRPAPRASMQPQRP